MSDSSKVFLIVPIVLILLWIIFPDLCSQFALAALLAFLLCPLTDWIQKKLKLRRSVAVIATLFVLLLVFAGIILIACPVCISQAKAFVAQWEIYQKQGSELLQLLGIERTDQIKSIADWIRPVIAQLTTAAQNLMSIFAAIGVVLISIFYLLLEPAEQYRKIFRLFPLSHQAGVEKIALQTGKMIRCYFRSRLLLALFAAVFCGIGFLLLGLENILLYVVILFLLDFVPYIGPLIAGILPVTVSYFEGGIWLAAAVVLILFAAQQIEESILGPKLQADAVGVHPLAGLFVMLAAVRLFGTVGAVLAMPIAGFLRILIEAVFFSAESGQKIILAEEKV